MTDPHDDNEQSEGRLGGLFLLASLVVLLVIACACVVGARALVRIAEAVTVSP